MKLKKIVSLALAGILAVSMLTACGEGSSSSTVIPPVNNTPTSAIATALNNKLSGKQADLLSFEANSTLADALAWMNGEHSDSLLVLNSVIENAGYPTLLNTATADENAVIQRVLRGLNGLKPAVAALGQFVIPVNTTTNNAYLYVWTVDASVGSVDAVASHIMNGNGTVASRGLQRLVYNVIGAVDDGNAAAPGNNMDYEYKGYAEMVKVSNSLSTDSAYVVAVLIEQFPTTNT